jgi:hypothetical protein
MNRVANGIETIEANGQISIVRERAAGHSRSSACHSAATRSDDFARGRAHPLVGSSAPWLPAARPP